ncbi:MAG: putative Ig domain-containing protein, partial [Planctomycetota bacterium]
MVSRPHFRCLPVLVLCLLSFFAVTPAQAQVAFTRGDTNGDGVHNMGDVVALFAFLFQSGQQPTCRDACDVSDDGNIDIGDGVYLLTYLFTNGAPPAAPQSCGMDPTPDNLDCVAFAACVGVNQPPTITSTPPQDATEMDEFSYQVVAIDSNGDPLTYSAPSAPDGAAIDANGLLTWTPTAMQVGLHQFHVVASDPSGASAEQFFDVTVQDVNQPPHIMSQPGGQAICGNLYEYDIDAMDPDPGDSITYSLQQGPSSINVDPTTGMMSWIPGHTEEGVHNLAVRAQDSGGEMDVQTFVLSVTADCDGDGIPDDQEPDCDSDGTPDDCESDCDGDGIPDDCDVGFPQECIETSCASNIQFDPAFQTWPHGEHGFIAAFNLNFTVFEQFVFTTPAVFVESPDGTATLTGTLESRQNPTGGFTLSVTFSSFVSSSDPIPAGSPQLFLTPNAYFDMGGPVDHRTWRYYTNLTGTLVGTGIYSGAQLDLALGSLPATQLGEGANGANTLDGLGTWADVNIVSQPTTGPAFAPIVRGDINVSLAAAGADCDNDGTPDCAEADCDGDGIPDDCEGEPDCNGNGIPDSCDIASGAAADVNNNGIPDSCEADCDGDGTPDDMEPDCDNDGTPDDCETEPDCNGNNIPDSCDIANGMPDTNGNGVPDGCDPDCDNDGTPDHEENDCDNDGTPDDCEGEPDCNGNNIPDSCDIAAGAPDMNGNGIPDSCEGDCDNDGTPDDMEPDCDNDGTPDDCEGEPDCNGNNIPDSCDIAAGHPDLDGNGVPDSCDPDCDNDGTPDHQENDCDNDGTPDDCEGEPDCNTNGIPDSCDIAGGMPDTNGNGVPDVCDPDCDNDGTPDHEETDCDGDGTPDDCESEPDCNGNNIPDSCDIAAGAQDMNGNGIPDTCEGDCDGDGIPDDMEPDCDGDGTPDDCDSGYPDECTDVFCVGDAVFDPAITSWTNGPYGFVQFYSSFNEFSRFSFLVPGVFTELPDGTATLTGTVTDATNPNACFTVDLTLTGLITASEPVPAGSPQLFLSPSAYVANGGTVDPDTWRYYPTMTGTMTGCGDYTGALFNIAIGTFPALQVGEGANGANTLNGLGTWMEVAIASQPNSGPQFPSVMQGDINVRLDAAGADCDGDGTPDCGEPDCDGDGIPDDCDDEPDCDNNGIPDNCDIANGAQDMNGNGIPDSCEADCDGDGTPDDMEPDCDNNGTPDDCENEPDCNGNNIPDSCD